MEKLNGNQIVIVHAWRPDFIPLHHVVFRDTKAIDGHQSALWTHAAAFIGCSASNGDGGAAFSTGVHCTYRGGFFSHKIERQGTKSPQVLEAIQKDVQEKKISNKENNAQKKVAEAEILEQAATPKASQVAKKEPSKDAPEASGTQNQG